MSQKSLCLLLLSLSVLLPAGCGSYSSRWRQEPPPESGAAAARRALGYEERRRFDGLFLEAVRLRERQRYDAEYELLRAALAINPSASEALYELALLHLSLSSFSDSTHNHIGDSLLRRAVALDPRNRFFKETLGKLCADKGDYGRAISIYEELAEGPHAVDALAMLVGLYEENLDYEGAIRALDRLEMLEGRNESYSLEKFKIYIETGNDERAYAAIEALCAEYPSDLRYRVLLGDLYRQQGHLEMALAVYRDVLTLEPDNAFAQLSLLDFYGDTGEDSLYKAFVGEVVLNPATQSPARVEIMKNYAVEVLSKPGGDTARVYSLFKQALRQPQEDRALAELAASFVELCGMPSDSLTPVLRQVLSVEPDYSRARRQLLQILARENDDDGALQLCREGQLYEPAQLVYYYYEGVFLYRLGRLEEALAALRRGAERIDDDADMEAASELYAAMGDILYELKRQEEAFAACDSALACYGGNLSCLNNYAYYLSQAGKRLEQAESMARRVVEAEPRNPTYLDTYAWVLFVRKQYAQARIYIDETLRYAEPTDPQNASLFEHAGDIYYKCNDRRTAVELWKTALGLTADARRRAVLKKKVKYKRYYAG